MSKLPVTIVSGLPRSGTSMMMRMLEAGGMSTLKDEVRKADDDNPGGYYEYERVKQTRQDPSWLEGAGGKVVKMVSRLLMDLPGNYEYNVLFMRREMPEILASQRKMLKRRGQAAEDVDDLQMTQLFEAHLGEVDHWLGEQANHHVLPVWYGDIMEQTEATVARINSFLGGVLDESRMTAVVDRSLYRNRANPSEVQPG